MTLDTHPSLSVHRNEVKPNETCDNVNKQNKLRVLPTYVNLHLGSIASPEVT